MQILLASHIAQEIDNTVVESISYLCKEIQNLDKQTVEKKKKATEILTCLLWKDLIKYVNVAQESRKIVGRKESYK